MARNKFQIFSSTDYPINRTTKLWRYLTFEEFVWFLEASRLYLTRLDKLGDPFEGSCTEIYVKKRDSGKTKSHFSLATLEPFIFKRLMVCSFATCWHASEHESAAMWKLYSAEDAGVAVVSSPERIRDATYLGRNPQAILGPVEYLDFHKHDMRLPMGKVARPGFVKRKSFEHEREVRGMVILDSLPSGKHKPELTGYELLQHQMPQGLTIRADLEHFIEAIHVSPLAPPYVFDLVRRLAKRRGVGHAVKKSSLLGNPVY